MVLYTIHPKHRLIYPHLKVATLNDKCLFLHFFKLSCKRLCAFLHFLKNCGVAIFFVSYYFINRQFSVILSRSTYYIKNVWNLLGLVLVMPCTMINSLPSVLTNSHWETVHLIIWAVGVLSTVSISNYSSNLVTYVVYTVKPAMGTHPDWTSPRITLQDSGPFIS